jgi:hypothetical protein
MKKIILFFVSVLFSILAFSQDSTIIPKKKTIDLSNRPNDHFLIQFGYAGWSGKPDSINTGSFSKSFNVYFMFDFPFKTNPHLSMAFGPGISTDHIVFSKTAVGIKDLTTTFRFTDQADTNHFKKTKLATAYLEAPIEFRYSADPLTGKGLKTAIGIKVGTMISAHTRNTKYETSTGTLINDYVMKEASKHFFNKTRLVAIARVGLGHFSIFGSYQLTTLIKDGLGPIVKPYSIGLTLSGL